MENIFFQIADIANPRTTNQSLVNHIYNVNSAFVLILFVYTFKNKCKYFTEAIIVGMILLMARQEIRCFDFEETKAIMSDT